VDSERRSAPRYPVALEIGVNSSTGVTMNMSSSGVYFVTEHVLAPDQQVALVFPFEHAAPTGTRAACSARVLRVESRSPGYGIAATYEAITFQLPLS